MTDHGALHLGSVVEGSEAPDGDGRVVLDASDLTTHGVIVGMTGSGKTGLGVVALEEALASGIPALVLDPKGDMANLCLTFPDFAPADFRPWIDEAEAARAGVTPDALAATTAEGWRKGLAGSGITPEHVRSLRDGVDVTVYTPGSTTGIGIDLVGRLDAPAGADAQAIDDEVTDVVSGLLALVGIEADPLTGREHILLANLLADAWRKGERMDLATIVARVQDPPIRKLGVMDLDTFFPAKDRMGLALRLNGLLASPTFASWAQGVPLDIERMLFTADGGPRCAVISLAHLDDPERQFVVTLVLSRLITWMRGQPGTSSLRALVYMDEVFGFVPPVATPPSKGPILTILKQARAFGVGMILSTQNPVDLDYKAISNAGTWMIGRLQTEQDKARLLDGMRSSDGSADVEAISAAIGGLAKRQFVLHSSRGGTPVIFSTRWAMSYLRGPLTGPQIATLMADQKAELAMSSPPPVADVPEAVTAIPGTGSVTGPAAASPPVEATDAGAAAAALSADESPVPPAVPATVVQRFVDPAAPWAAGLGAVAGGRRLRPHVAIRVRLRFDEARAGLDHVEEFEALLPVNDEPTDLTGLTPVDYDDRDLRDTPPDGAVYVLPAAPITTATWWSTVERSVRDELHRSQSRQLLHNPELKLWGRPAETDEAFRVRCEVVAEEQEDVEAERVRARMATKTDRLRAAVDRARDRAGALEQDRSSSRSSEIVNIGSSILGGFLGGRRSARGIAADLRRAADRRGRTAKVGQKLEAAEAEAAGAEVEMMELEEELAVELLDIDHRFMEAAKAIEHLEVGLEKGDIDVVAVTLAWLPTSA